MLGYSLYPTDSESVFNAVVAQAKANELTCFFVSLHMPEAKDLLVFLTKIKQLHEQYNWSFFADISPRTLELLTLDIAGLRLLKESGVKGLRLDFGFSTADVVQIAQLGFAVAMNASTISAREIEGLQNVPFIGWHNYYPRPETGLSAAYFAQQNKLLTTYGKTVYSFIPGDKVLRAPLGLGLPTLEIQRGRNAYINYLEQRLIYRIDHVFVAEGTLSAADIAAIKLFENEQIITIPCAYIDERYAPTLLGKNWRVRVEETDYSWRLLDTRGLIEVTEEQSEHNRRQGAIQVDTQGYGRYAGEIHLLKQNLPANRRTEEIGCVEQEYLALLAWLSGSPTIQFRL